MITYPTPSSKIGTSDRARANGPLRTRIRALFSELMGEPVGSPRRQRMRAELIELNVPLVRHLARRFESTTEPIEDVRQVGMVGLIKAVDRYDPDRGAEFSTFAVPTILGEIRRYFRDSTWCAHVPRGARELSSSITTTTPALMQRLGREPNTSDLAAALGTDEQSIDAALHARNAYVGSSLEAMAEELGSGAANARLRCDDAGLEQAERRVDLRPALASLPERQRAVIALRFVYDKSQTQIAAILGVSQMQISRLLSRSLKQLRDQLERPRPTVARIRPAHV